MPNEITFRFFNIICQKMPKTPSQKLFQLIRSLNGTEKRYLKVIMQERPGSNKYIRLFDAMARQDAFDEDALREQIYPGEPVESRKYSELKAYLYDWILKNLRAYDEESSIDFQLKGLLQSIRVLFKRARYEDCKELIVKAKKIARQYEDFISLIELLRWEKQIAYAEMNVSFFDHELSRIDQEEKTYLEQLSNASEYRNIFFKLYVSIRMNAFLRSEDKIAYLKSVVSQPLLQDIARARSHLARILYHRIYSLYYFSILDIHGFNASGKYLLDVMESQPFLLKEDMSEYIAALGNYTLSCGLLEEYDSVRECLNKFLLIKANTIDDRLKIHRHYYSTKFSLCIYTGEFEEGLQALNRHFEELKQFGNAAFETSSFYFLYFYIYFGNRDYDKAQDYLNDWLNLPRSIERQDMQGLARIINLIIHYEMGNTLLLEHLLRSTYRFLQQKERLFEFERSILGFIRDVQKIRTRKELKDAFVYLQEHLVQLSQIPSEKAMLGYFDIIAWLDSKITGKPFAIVVKERYLSSKNKPLA